MKKRLLALTTALLALLSTAVRAEQPAPPPVPVQAEFYVAANGNDGADGSKSTPFATPERAQQAVRAINRDMTGDIVVHIGSGRYELAERLRFTEADSGSNGFHVRWEGDVQQVPTFSGGSVLRSEWTEGEDGIWRIKAEGFEHIRELFVNETPAVRARSERKFTGKKNYIASDSDFASDGFYADAAQIGQWNNAEDIELHWCVGWKSAMAHVEALLPDPEDKTQTIVKMRSDEWSVHYTAGGNHPAGYGIGFLVENALELLDEPGEFYYDRHTKVLSYLPREGEDLRTAEIIVPRLDQVMKIEGRGYESRIQNIRFENIRFAHGTWDMLNDYSVHFHQGNIPTNRKAAGGYTPGFVHLGWTDGVDITNCVFFGATTTGLRLAQGVSNGVFSGNVFTDLGESAIVVGDTEQYEVKPAPSGSGAADVSTNKAYWMSYLASGGFFSNQYLDIDVNIWRSARNGAQPEEVPWIIIDLDDPYLLDRVELDFSDVGEEKVSRIERSNILVQASNSPKFETFETLGEIGQNTADKVTIKCASENRYRYLRLIKTSAQPFAIRTVFAYSYDRKPQGQQGYCHDLKIENNYIARIGSFHYGACAMLLYYTKNVSVQHNEIHDVPYTGISVGWGWSRVISTTAGNNVVNHNRIDGFMEQANDGGAIYMLGNQPGSEICGNYLSGQGNVQGAIYPDEGSSYIKIDSNVAQNVANTLFFWIDTVKDNTATNTWADSSVYKNDGTNVMVEPLKLFTANNPLPEMAQIIADAGLTQEYEAIRARVPENPSALVAGPDMSESYMRANTMAVPDRAKYHKQSAETFLSRASFGTQPGQYAPEVKLELEAAIEAQDQNPTILTAYALKDAYENAIASVRHESLEDTVALAEALTESAKEEKSIGGYRTGAVKKFREKINAVKQMPAETEAQRLTARYEMEQALIAFEESRYSADILTVWSRGGVCELNAAEKTAVLRVPSAADSVAVSFALSPGAQLGTDAKTLAIGETKSIPIFQPELQQYSYWTVRIESDAPQSDCAEVVADRTAWHNSNPNMEVTNAGGMAALQAWFEPYVFDAAASDNYRFTLNVPRADNTDGIEILFSAQDGTPAAIKNDAHYALNLKGNTLTLAQKNDGERVQCAVNNDCGFRYGEDVSVEIKVVREGKCNHIIVWLDGKKVIDTLASNPIATSGYLGIATNNMTVKVGGRAQ